jgi:hypothetical protein
MLTQPHVITGHPSCIELVAESINLLPVGFAPWLVVSRGEILHGRTRALLEEVFGCRVDNYSNCDEIGNIAWDGGGSPVLAVWETGSSRFLAIGDSNFLDEYVGADGNLTLGVNMVDWLSAN